MRRFPLIIEPTDLEPTLGDADLLVVDLCKATTYTQAHVPGAVHLEYSNLVRGTKPVPGLLPDAAQLSKVLSAIGLRANTQVVAYDDEGGGKACRLIWTLNVLGHTAASLLNGGIYSWANEGHALSNEHVTPTTTQYTASILESRIATKNYILQHLDDAEVALLDARTPEEYHGIKVRAARGGHIPGALNFNWLDAINRNRNYRLLPDADLRTVLAERGFRHDQEIITYCQTHHRSAHSYVMLKHLGFEKAKGYPGSWSEWGNDPDTPVET